VGADTFLTMRRLVLLSILAGLLVPVAATRAAAPPFQGEGKLELLTWEGYAQRTWVVPFERSTHCSVSAAYAHSPAEMARAIQERGRFDLVSAGGDIARRLIGERLVSPLDLRRVPPSANFFAALRAPSFTTVGGVHYGIATLWGANVLVYNAAKVAPPPRSWSVVYDERYRGRITVPDNPLQIADAALYLAATKPALGIRDPYRLTRAQLAAAVALLQRQRPFLASYWAYATDEVHLFEDGRAWLGPGWSWQADRLAEGKVAVRTVVPREGVTGWADSWMLAAEAKHPRCAYAWLRWISQPAVQAELAVDYGAAPASRLACPYMESIERGSCAAAHANASPSYLRSIHFWQTPGAGCAACAGEDAWLRAWAEVRR
jgi:putative spermidine/putrescine transport system substrate-binding protein